MTKLQQYSEVQFKGMPIKFIYNFEKHEILNLKALLRAVLIKDFNMSMCEVYTLRKLYFDHFAWETPKNEKVLNVRFEANEVAALYRLLGTMGFTTTQNLFSALDHYIVNAL